jgi:glycosyltransferase involved in cell wall biosynthesis
MPMSIGLVWLSEEPTTEPWPLGLVHCCTPSPAALSRTLQEMLHGNPGEGLLFWHPSVGPFDIQQINGLLQQPGDLWHAGLRLGLAGQPGLIDFVAPTWMLNRDPDPDIVATSWRLSLRACLVRTEVLRQLGGPHPHFQSLDGAALELGHRYAVRGAFPRAWPALLAQGEPAPPVQLPFADELRFVYYRFGRFWSYWALARAVLSGYISPLVAAQAARTVLADPLPLQPAPYRRPAPAEHADLSGAQVSVLIPTLDRYSYLHTVLRQLGEQTVPPLEVIVVDQTASAERQQTLAQEFPDLPLRVHHQEQPGQCSSRNWGLQAAQGDYVIFLDDDEEVEPDFIEQHFIHLHRTKAVVSSGVICEVGSKFTPANFSYNRISDVFPAGNTMIAKEVLRLSGLFDLAYERGQRADGDLGMRVYLSGALMALSADIVTLHHHAPRGGLRAHKARVITYASSRQRLTHRHLPSVSEIYKAQRYFTKRQVREMLWMWALGTLSVHGSRFRRLAKATVGFILLPDTLLQIRRRARQAAEMMNRYPQIPPLVATTPEQQNKNVDKAIRSL